VLKLVDRVLFWALSGLLALAMLAIAVLVFMQVLWRYFLQQPLTWSEEVIRYSLIWGVFIGAALLSREGGHVVVDFLVARLSPGPRRVIRIAVSLVVVGLLAMLSKGGWEFVLSNRGMTTPAIGMPMALVYSSVPVGLTLMAVYFFRDLVISLRGEQGRFRD
jgi:TRAP-type C4-dicarboxylate transport system permease small subunit